MSIDEVLRIAQDLQNMQEYDMEEVVGELSLVKKHQLYSTVQRALCDEKTLETQLYDVIVQYTFAHGAINMAYGNLSNLGSKSMSVENAQNQAYAALLALESAQIKLEKIQRQIELGIRYENML